MKILFLIISIFFISSPSWSETVSHDDLKVKNGFYYKKFSIFSPLNFLFGFTGIVESYYENGNLRVKGNFKDGKENGLWEWYYENGKLKKKEITKKDCERTDFGNFIIRMVSYWKKEISNTEKKMVLGYHIITMVSYGQKKITKMEYQMVIWKNIHLVVS